MTRDSTEIQIQSSKILFIHYLSVNPLIPIRSALIMSSANGESSNRPVPTRTMPQPARLTVAQRGATGQVDSSNITDVEALKNDLDRRKLVARKAEKWADKMMEETLSSPIFKKAVGVI